MIRTKTEVAAGVVVARLSSTLCIAAPKAAFVIRSIAPAWEELAQGPQRVVGRKELDEWAQSKAKRTDYPGGDRDTGDIANPTSGNYKLLTCHQSVNSGRFSARSLAATLRSSIATAVKNCYQPLVNSCLRYGGPVRTVYLSRYSMVKIP
jgi:hypothetical protein